MNCSTCGSSNPDGVKFCTQCGAPLEGAEQIEYGQTADRPIDVTPDENVQPALDSAQPYGDPNQQPYGDPNQQQYGYGAQGQQYGQQQYGGYTDPNQQYNAGYQPPPANAAFQGMGVGLFPERNLAVAIILTLITCGLYAIYWMYTITEDSNKISGEPNPSSGGMVILLSIVTCGIYSLYWMYKRGEIIDRYNQQRGLPDGSNSIIYLLLGIFGFGIVSYGLMQYELNKIATGRI